MGEFYQNLALEEGNAHLGTTMGVYRLKVTGLTGASSFTQCIPYNVTAAALSAVLDALPIIANRGGTTVRRYGQPNSYNYRFGYTYRIEMDSVTTQYFQHGPLTIALDCYGVGACNCADTKVQLVDSTGIPECPVNTSYSLLDPTTCIIPPTITVARISTLSHTTTSGAGTIEVQEGVHRFPPVSACTLAVTHGTGVGASDLIDWTSVAVNGDGRLVLAGTSWDSWDSSYLLYAPEWTTGRGFIKTLATAPPFNMFAQNVLVGGSGSVLSSCTKSNMTWQNSTWAGGIIGGRSTVTLTQHMLASDSNKSLRYGLTLIIAENATIEWISGNVSLADGANIIIEGKLLINTESTGVPIFVGEAQLLQVGPTDTVGQLLLIQAQGRSWHSYYGDELPSDLRGGWYQNPLCGDKCLNTNQLIVRVQA